MGPIGIPELIIVLVILLVIFGPKRLPGLGRSLGSGMKEFKDSVTGDSKPDHDATGRELPAAPDASAVPQPAPTTAEPATVTRTDEAPVTEPRA